MTRYINFKAKGWHYFLLDFCYTTNYWVFLYFFICLVKSRIAIFSFLGPYLDWLGYYLFRIAYAWSLGPLALSIAVFRNALVFHSTDHMTILAVHLGPPLVCSSIRWYSDQLEESWPNTFHFDVNREMSNTETLFTLWVLPTIFYIFLWTIPYSVLIFILRAEKIKEKGYVTMYSYYEQTLFSMMKNIPDALKPVLYMLLHGSLCIASFLLSQILWRATFLL